MNCENIENLPTNVESKYLMQMPTNTEDTEKEKFIKHLEWATSVVKTWPEWKRNLLGKIDYYE